MLTDASPPNIEVVIAPPSLYLLLAREHLSKNIEVAAQNVFDKPNGAFTGEISTEQLKDSGIGWVLTGHSERRVILGEEDGVSARDSEDMYSALVERNRCETRQRNIEIKGDKSDKE